MLLDEPTVELCTYLPGICFRGRARARKYLVKLRQSVVVEHDLQRTHARCELRQRTCSDDWRSDNRAGKQPSQADLGGVVVEFRAKLLITFDLGSVALEQLCRGGTNPMNRRLLPKYTGEKTLLERAPRNKS